MTNKERGKRTQAGKLLTSFIRDIAEEETEFIKNSDSVEDKMATKAEALARLIWKRALGFEEIKEDKNGVPITLVHAPDKGCIAVIFDRMEGKAPAALDEGAEKLTAAERVSEQGKKRIAEVGGLND